MNYRTAMIHARETIEADKTFLIDIDVADPISQILVVYQNLNAGDVPTAHPAACITKIEVVDGSDVLINLDGYECQALDHYSSKGEKCPQWLQYLNNNYCDQAYRLSFGRWLWDPELALDPKQFRNLQLKVSVDLDAGGNASDAGRLEVTAQVFDQKSISPVGFLMAKELKEYTMADASHEYTDLPTDFPYRQLLFRAALAGTEPNQCIENLKLSEDQDKRVIFDASTRSLWRNFIDGAYVTEHILFAGATSLRYLYTKATSQVAAAGNYWINTGAGGKGISFYNGDGGRLDTWAEAAANYQCLIQGYLPHSTMRLPFGDQMDPTDWYDVRNVGNLKLDVLGNAASTGFIVAQQLKTY